jgi:hypothetical protein
MALAYSGRLGVNKAVLVPCIPQPEQSSKGYIKGWVRLILTIYKVDPLIGQRC